MFNSLLLILIFFVFLFNVLHLRLQCFFVVLLPLEYVPHLSVDILRNLTVFWFWSIIVELLLSLTSGIYVVHELYACVVEVLNLFVFNWVERHDCFIDFGVVFPLIAFGPTFVAGGNVSYVSNLVCTKHTHYMRTTYIIMLIKPTVTL